ncbi:MAG: hypothetical protein QOJ99_3610 [Bryobacterales bacterium]|jgi:hypothetical protein|nr:hypothetical protein [Bryobacterales bacterium]
MTTRQTLIATACFASLCGALQGQTGEKTASFQYFINNDPVAAKMAFRVDGIGKTVTGKPFSAAEERQTVQVLGDGTRIDKKETDKYFRDNQGRARIERNNGETIIISDPVDGFSAELNATNKSAHKMIVRMRTTTGPVGPSNTVMIDKFQAEMGATRAMPAVAAGTLSSQNMGFTRAEAVPGKEPQNAATEDLGTQIINGVPAQGTRSTITIPAGQIGNDREIKVVSERWFSNDLQMLIKSSNNDPRFGETTYQLTNVIQGAQDPTLFQIPADFNVNGPPR